LWVFVQGACSLGTEIPNHALLIPGIDISEVSKPKRWRAVISGGDGSGQRDHSAGGSSSMSTPGRRATIAPAT
jgi:aminopeptidase C